MTYPNNDLPRLHELGLLSLTDADVLAFRLNMRNEPVTLPPIRGNATHRPLSSSSLPSRGQARARRAARRGTPYVHPSQRQPNTNNRTLGSRLDASLDAAPVERFDGAARRVDDTPTLVWIIESIPGMTASQGDEGRGEGSSRRRTRRDQFRSYYYNEDGQKTEWIHHHS
ncbi:hypothetical protein JB92DRAFT_2826066 [Gautieria morchelliformis]|nr:hypothetical protein JB92DRAFT_2826066 [Gautieria morchelliformis]